MARTVSVVVVHLKSLLTYLLTPTLCGKGNISTGQSVMMPCGCGLE